MSSIFSGQKIAFGVYFPIGFSIPGPKKEADMKKILGLCFLLFAKVDGVLKLFTVEELKEKAVIFKEKGMIGPPYETIEPNEGLHDAFIRLTKEEMGIPLESVSIFSIVPMMFSLIPGKEGEIRTMYAYGIFTGDTTINYLPADREDVRFAGWKTIEEVRTTKPRIETNPLLDDFIESGHYDKVVQDTSST